MSVHLRLPEDPEASLSLVVIGAHPDDIEIGAGGTLLSLAGSQERLKVRYVVLTGSDERRVEARAAATAFLPGADVAVELHDLPEGRLPARWAAVKEILEAVAGRCTPDVVLAPSPLDAHQDHRTIGEIVPSVFRRALHLAYEIPKWDGDLRRPTAYVPLDGATARRKVELLRQCYPSQCHREWWDEEVFLGLARLRGVECHAPYAEAFQATKVVIEP